MILPVSFFLWICVWLWFCFCFFHFFAKINWTVSVPVGFIKLPWLNKCVWNGNIQRQYHGYDIGYKSWDMWWEYMYTKYNNICIYIYIMIYIYIVIYNIIIGYIYNILGYIYIYGEREREEKKRETDIIGNVYIYIYIYTYIYIYIQYTYIYMYTHYKIVGCIKWYIRGMSWDNEQTGMKG